VGNERAVRGAKDNNVVHPFEDVFNSMVPKDVKKSICRTSLYSSGCGQSFHCTMSNENGLIP